MPKKTKKKEPLYTWGMMLTDLDRAVRTKELGPVYDYQKMYVIGLRTMEKMGAKRSDELSSGAHMAAFDTACGEVHKEYNEYQRLNQLFAPHHMQYFRTKYPNPKEDFHAAWVKAGEDNA